MYKRAYSVARRKVEGSCGYDEKSSEFSKVGEFLTLVSQTGLLHGVC
jgi:hypothetical protein